MDPIFCVLIFGAGTPVIVGGGCVLLLQSCLDHHQEWLFDQRECIE